ncbi:low-density lipoprotein receptor-related protein 10 [Eublepharis macularius]|uniref:Low-density lipoprotein receptor-related protein 10 n=1 Tax=Eublepharis macularius TaxID=481883 RepID=A0AA97K6G6_EUBMA|nr:low-density lipoprotein receptor-related protein 10 [Eublepharis macularius]
MEPHVGASQPPTAGPGRGGPPTPLLMPSGAARTLLLGLLWGAIPTVESSPSYMGVCQGYPDIRREFPGQIRSPSLQGMPYSSCSWVILGEPEDIISIRFQRFRLICGSEVLTIHSSSQPTKKFCGYNSPEPLQIKGGNVTLSYSWKFVAGDGFLLKYERERTFSKPRITTSCGQGNRCPSTSSSSVPVDQATGWGQATTKGMRWPPWLDQLTRGAASEILEQPQRNSSFRLRGEFKPPACNLTLDNFYGVIFSPAFAPDSHPGAAHCQWALDAHDSRPLSIRFTIIDLDIRDSLHVYEGVPGSTPHPRLLRNLDYTSNGKVVSVDSPSSRAWVLYQAVPGRMRLGFNATYHVRGYCVPWDFPCGGGDGEGASCYSAAEHCDGIWDCANGADEDGCSGCPHGQFACGGRGIGGAACYGPADRCNYQTFCADAADERHCHTCQPGNFRCRDGRCIYESWVCDGQPDCTDASDEADCAYVLPRKVVTAAVIGSLVCGLLLVIALGCTCRLYALRSHEFGILAPMSRMEAQMIHRQAPPSYGQLIARGVIPPVDGFPTEHPSQNSMLGNLRSLLHLLRRDPAAAAAANGSRQPHRSRFQRRLVRRMRRWGLLPRPVPSSSAATTITAAAATSSLHSVPDILPESVSGEENTTSVPREEQAPPLPQKVPPTPAPLPEPCAPPPHPTPRLSGMMQTLRVRLFPSAPPCSVEASDTLSVPPSPEDDDDVLLVPLTEPRLQNTVEVWDDEPLLT